jgi:hypothetical protein
MSGCYGQKMDGCFSCIDLPLVYQETSNKDRDT